MKLKIPDFSETKTVNLNYQNDLLSVVLESKYSSENNKEKKLNNIEIGNVLFFLYGKKFFQVLHRTMPNLA